ncbi:MAG: hypothetical protein KC621_14195, partial [Myxococcales bacterium]|nr:hypothetical protein [Myxococcales bacterium]
QPTAALDFTRRGPWLPLDAADGNAARTEGVRFTSAEDRTLFRVPVQIESDTVRIELDGVLQRLEWGASLVLAIEDDDGHALASTRVRGTGGGAWVFPELRCDTPIDTPARLLDATLPQPDLPIRWALVHVEGRADRCRMGATVVDGPRTNVVRGPAWIRLSSADEGDAQLSRVVVGALRLYGATAREVPTTSDEQARLALAEGRTADALAGPARTRLAAETASGDPRAATTFAGFVAEAPEAVPALLRTDGRDRLRTFADPRDRVRAWLSAFGASAYQHPDDPDLQRHLREDLAELPDLALPEDPDERAAWLRLLVERAHALVAAGDVLAARRHLTLARDGLATLPDLTRHDLALMVAVDGVRLARAEGDEEAAELWHQTCRALTPFPELLDDSLSRL